MAAPNLPESLFHMRTSRRVLRSSLPRIERALRSCATLEQKKYYLGRLREEAHEAGNGQCGYLAFCYESPGEMEMLALAVDGGEEEEVSLLTSAQHLDPAEGKSGERLLPVDVASLFC